MSTRTSKIARVAKMLQEYFPSLAAMKAIEIAHKIVDSLEES